MIHTVPAMAMSASSTTTTMAVAGRMVSTLPETRRDPRLGDGGLVCRESAPPWGGLGGYPITPRVLNVPLA